MKNLEKSMVGSLRGRPARGDGEGAPVSALGGAGCLVLRRPWPILPAGGEGRGGSAASAPRLASPDEGRGRQRAGAPSRPRFRGLQLLVTSLRPLGGGRGGVHPGMSEAGQSGQAGVSTCKCGGV